MTTLHRNALNACLGLALLLAAPATAIAQDPGPSRGNGLSTAQGIRANLGLTQAIETAERESKGRAIEATFSPFATGGGSLEVTLMRNDATVTKYRIDANSGEVVNVTEQTLQGYTTSIEPAMLTGMTLRMSEAVKAAEMFVQGGTAIGVAVEKSNDDMFSFEINVLKDGAEQAVVVKQDGTVTPSGS